MSFSQHTWASKVPVLENGLPDWQDRIPVPKLDDTTVFFSDTLGRYWAVKPDGTIEPITNLNFEGSTIIVAAPLGVPDITNVPVPAPGYVTIFGDVNGVYYALESDGVTFAPLFPTAGVIKEFNNVFALMPPDNAAPVAVGGDVDFPENGPKNGTVISRTDVDKFNLAEIGSYEINCTVSVDEPGQLQVTLNNVAVAHTTSGRATGTSQIVINTIIETVLVNSVLTIRNPAGNAAALTITPIAGGASAVAANLVIKKIK